MTKTNKHDALVEIIEQELWSRGIKETYKFEEYNKGVCGEIDLYARKDNYVLLFEMKSNDTYKARKKAIQQLDRAEKYCFKNKRVFKFYVTNCSNPKIEWIKKYK